MERSMGMWMRRLGLILVGGWGLVAWATINPLDNPLSIDLSVAENNDYGAAMALSQQLGAQQVGLHLSWKGALEPQPGTFTPALLDIANAYYPLFGFSVDLNIDPIETNVLEVPDDLAELPLDSPVVITRFQSLLDSVFAHVPDLQLSSLIIGSEVDIRLGLDAAAWAQYTAFYQAAAAHARALRPGLPIVCEGTFGGLTGESADFYQALNQDSDIIGVSYYPLNGDFTVQAPGVVHQDFATLVARYPDQPIVFYQLGYPTSALCASSEQLQAEFVTQVFQAWDEQSGHVRTIDFTWLHDASPATVAEWALYYGLDDPAFLAFLGSLGLRTWPGAGADKAGFTELACQAFQHGYSTVECVSGVPANPVPRGFGLSAAPNPFNPATSLSFQLESALPVDLTIHDLAGRQVCRLVQGPLSAGAHRFTWDGRLSTGAAAPSGLYLAHLRTEQGAMTQRLLLLR